MNRLVEDHMAAGKGPAFSGTDAPKDDQTDADGFHDPGPEPDPRDDDGPDLGATAAAGLPETGSGQQVLEGTDSTRIKFVGMSLDALKEDPLSAIRLGEERTFLVRARAVSVSDDLLATGGERHVVKMSVNSVVPQDDK